MRDILDVREQHHIASRPDRSGIEDVFCRSADGSEKDRFMTDGNIILAIFRSKHIQKDTRIETVQYIEDWRQRQKVLLEDLIAEQCEGM